MVSETFRVIRLPAGLKPKTGLLWFWLVGLALAPLFPLSNFVGHPHWDIIRWIPFQDFSLSPRMLVDVFGNIVWFMIFGYLLHYWMTEEAFVSRSIAPIILITAGISISIEFFQIFCHNRIPATTDVICNVIGAGLGAAFSEQHRFSSASKPILHLALEDDASKTTL
ncbi:MAG: VanZ family protein [Nitrospiraceae bacterium]